MCLDDQILNTYLDGELVEPWKTQVEEHLSYCSACKARYDQLVRLHAKIAATALSTEEIAPRQQKVLRFMEMNYLSKKKKISFFHKKVKVGIPAMLTAAAVFMVVFIGAFVLIGANGKKTAEILPTLNMNADPGSVILVKDNQQTATQQYKPLESYTLEEIIHSLDARGYEVDIRLKGITPIEVPKTPEVEEEPEVIAEIEL